MPFRIFPIEKCWIMQNFVLSLFQASKTMNLVRTDKVERLVSKINDFRKAVTVFCYECRFCNGLKCFSLCILRIPLVDHSTMI